ncbi:PA2169 family four-helix-bundle protein [Flavobacterium taihuense]|uniref:PA2169 family four-helix-bundle protein n=1 Tax=Flavobacterium taihuense TaxID=2857508 RepID=A0ABS6Y2D8_9FLAO|nr:PA2169 family four-helix-bundle protein [Flavobacterium taihuense]MBW4362269.1 PA2169 family four-helix-bundle protein [Flavobacterium taihuense]
MNTKKSIDVLNIFIGINCNRFERYTTASKQTNEADLKTLFAVFQEKSKRCKAELISEVHKLGGKPTKDSAAILLFFRIWMQLLSNIKIKDREDILNRCEYDTDVILKKYNYLLNNNIEHLTPNHQNMLKAQHQSIKKDHDTLKGLGDLLVTCRKFNLDT